MKPFDLQKALSGEPVVTRDGRKVTDIHFFKNVRTKFPLVVHIATNSSVDHYTIQGTWTEDFSTPENDLLMAEPETWVNVYNSKVRDEAWCSRFYQSEIEAKENIIEGNYQCTIKLKL